MWVGWWSVLVALAVLCLLDFESGRVKDVAFTTFFDLNLTLLVPCQTRWLAGLTL